MGLTAIPPLSTPISVANGGTGKTSLPKFSATKGTSQNFAAASGWVKCTWSEEVTDPNGTFASNKWTPGVVGTVRINARLSLVPNGGAVGSTSIAIRKNGAFDATTRVVGTYYGPATNAFQLGGSAQFETDADDYFEVWVNCEFNSVDTTAAAYTCFFDGEMIP